MIPTNGTPSQANEVSRSELLTTKQLADEWGLHYKTPSNWRVRGGGPPFVRLGGAIRYRRQDVEFWMASHLRTSTAPDSK